MLVLLMIAPPAYAPYIMPEPGATSVSGLAGSLNCHAVVAAGVSSAALASSFTALSPTTRHNAIITAKSAEKTDFDFVVFIIVFLPPGIFYISLFFLCGVIPQRKLKP